MAAVEDDQRLGRRLRALVDSLLDPHVFLDAVRDDDGAIVDFVYSDANEAACAYNQRERADLIGTRLLDVLPGHAATGVLASYAHVVDSGEPLVIDGLPYFNEILNEERRSDVRGIRVDDGLSLTWRDVTDRYVEQDRLRQVLTRYRLLAENASDIAYLTAPDLSLQWISPAVTRVIGWQPEDLLGTQFTEYMHPGDRHRAVDWAMSLASTGALTSARGGATDPVRLRTAAGAYLWCTLTGSNATDENGEYMGLVGAIHDVDELVRTREKAVLERVRLQSTLDSMLDPHAFLAPVHDGAAIVDLMFVDVNRATCRYLGVAREAIVGLRLSNVFPDAALLGLIDSLAEVLRGGDSLALDDFAYRSDSMRVPHHYDIRAVAVGNLLSCTVRDVTRRVLAEVAVIESETRFRLLAENSADIVVHLRDGICEWASPSIGTALGWDPSDALGLPGVAWVHPDDLVSVLEALAVVDAEGSNRARFRMMAKDGSYHWLDGHAAPFVDAAGNADGIVVSARVVDSEVREQEVLEVRARQDLLTGLANRAELFDHFSGRMSRSPRSGHLIAVVFADLDDFKSINDAYGHAAGDAYLRAVADRMVAGVRRGDFVARIGGDELLVVLDGVHDADEAVAIADKLRAAVADPVEALGVTMRGTISMGVTLADPGEAMDEVVARADRAMYAAKAGGRDRVIRLCTVDDH